MNRELLTSYYKKRGFDDLTCASAIHSVEALERFLKDQKSFLNNHEDSCDDNSNQNFRIDLVSLDSISLDYVKAYIQSLVETEKSELEGLLALARYFYLINRQDIYIFFTSLLGGLGVIENIQKNLGTYIGDESVQQIWRSHNKPRIGTAPEAYPQYTAAIMTSIESAVPIETVKKAFANNNHDISPEPFLQEQTIYEAIGNLDAYLKDYQKRKIEELQTHCDENKVWYEQTITQAVVDFAAANQEIMSAVRVDDVLYTTKIPYNPDAYLNETDDKMKRYYACHCPFVREAILTGEIVSENWCYCSAGFSKFPYEIIFNKTLEVEMVASVLKGDAVCRFAIKLK